MITVELATRLRAAGLPWSPASGDRFVIADRGAYARAVLVLLGR